MAELHVGRAMHAPQVPSPGIAAKLRDVWQRFATSFLDLLAPSPEGPAAIEIRSVTEQFSLTLRASFLRVPEPAATDPARARIYERAAALASETERPTWDKNYQLEQYLVDLYDGPTLETELDVRALEARRVLGAELGGWYAGELGRVRDREVKAPDPEAKATAAREREPSLRSLLGRLVNDLQWRYKIRETARGYRQQISRDTAIAFVGILVAFVLVLLFGLGPQWFLEATGEVPGSKSLRDPKVLCGILVLAGMAGAFGAGFSMLLNQNKRLSTCDLDDLKMLASRWVLGSRILVGCGAAMILLFILDTELLGGTAFPSFKSTPEGASLAMRDLALLVFWCFLSGFSEKLVPSILSRMEARALDSPGSRPAPQKPGEAGAQ